MDRLRISLFDRFKVETEGVTPAGFDSRKVQELFSYLLIYRGRLHARETLADLLWSDATATQARKYLRQALWQLQTALKSDDCPVDESILTVENEWVGVHLGDAVWLDVAQFEDSFNRVQGASGPELSHETAQELIDAVDLQAAGLLEGWYYDWCIYERERLHMMYLSILNKLMAYFERHEQYERALLYGHRILQFDRAHERTHYRMMRLYYFSGDRTAALRQHQRCALALEEELGVAPSKHTTALYEQVRNDELVPTSLAAAVAHPAPLAAAAPAQIDRLEALLSEFQFQVRQYMDALTTASATGA